MPLRTIPFGDGQVPTLGQGTWFMGEDPDERAREVRSLQLGLDLGMTLIDTAEMYGEGGAEEVVGEAIAGPARRAASWSARSIRRTPRARGVDRGLRAQPEAAWRPTSSTSTCCTGAAASRWRKPSRRSSSCDAHGKIRRWGVSNFDTDDMEELLASRAAKRCATNQVLYNLTRRGTE